MPRQASPGLVAAWHARLSGSGLTARQREIMELVARGYENREIAEELFLSPLTVKNHLKTILRIVGAKTRAQAVMVILGLAEPVDRSYQ